MTSETDLTQVLKLVMDRSNAKIRTIIPGRIAGFDPQTQRCSATPAVQSYYYDVDLEEPVAYEPPQITNCPVWFPAGGGFQITYPLADGDDCLILCAERSIDEWMATGNASSAPRDLRRFDFSDAIVLPGIRPAARPLDINDASLVITHAGNGAILRVNDDGTVYLGNSTADVVAQLESTLAQLEGHLTNVQTAMAAIVTAAAAPSTPVTTGMLAGYWADLNGSISGTVTAISAAKVLVATISE